MYTKDKNGNLKLDKLVEIDYVNYWGVNKSTFEEQKINVNGIKDSKGRTKIEAVLQYVKGDSLLEIACCPGELLRVAKEKGFRKVVGIAPEKEHIEQLKKETGAEIVEGFFEDYVTKDKFDTIVAMDLFEHIEDGQGFINKCKKLLNKDGVIILMLPLLQGGEELDQRHFNPEHIWLYQKEYIKQWLKPKSIDKWLNGHDIVVL